MSTKELKNEGKLFYQSSDQGKKKETKEKKRMRENTKLEKYFL